MNRCRYEDSNGIRPGYGCVLVPPSVHHHSHVETQDKRQRYHVTMETAVVDHAFEHPVDIQSSLQLKYRRRVTMLIIVIKTIV